MIARESIMAIRNRITRATNNAERDKHAGIRQYDEILNDLIAEVERTNESLWSLCHTTEHRDSATKWHVGAIVEAVLSVVQADMGYSPADILGDERTKFVVRARHIATYAAKILTHGTLKELGRVLNRDHSSIMHAVKRADTDPAMKKAAQDVAVAAGELLRAKV